MLAQDARRISEKNKYSDTDRNLEEVFTAIKNCSEKGAFYTDWHDQIDYSMITRLEQLGYKVTRDSSRAETFHQISWEKTK